MLNRAIEIHDSILASVSISSSQVDLRFSRVYIHQSEGKPGVDAGSVWVQEAVIRIYDAQAKGELSHFPVELTGGQVRVGDAYLNNEIPLPLRYNGRFELHLEPMWQSHNAVYFQGSGVDLELIGEPQYVEEFP